MIVPGCEREWEAVEKTLERYKNAVAAVQVILNRNPGTLDDLTESMGAKVIEDEAYANWKEAMNLYFEWTRRTSN